ncbi:MAG TPA: hypothetical protein VMV49_02580 [Candidatus Deferrimicrobium sp.]|nr:hypothetical protein [Candidatus Deferrimicrobium sp.]
MSKQTGMTLGIIGGVLSIILGIAFPWIIDLAYPELQSLDLGLINLIFQILGVTGGIIAIIGVAIVPSNHMKGRTIIIIGGVIGLINIITILGGKAIKEYDY